MLTVISTTFTVMLVLVAIVGHELGHLLAARELRLKVASLHIGLFRPRLSWQPRGWPFRLILTPWLLGAAVRLEEGEGEAVLRLPFRDQAWFFGAGVIANAVIGGCLIALSGVLALALNPHPTVGLDLGWIGGGLVLAWMAWRFRRFICPYMLLPLSVAFLATFTVLAVRQPTKTVMGPIEVARFLESHTLSQAALIAGLLSLNWALFNLLPVLVTDGSKVLYLVVRRYGERVGNCLMAAQAVLFVALITLAVLNQVTAWL